VNKEGHVKVADFGLAKNIKNKKFLTVKVVTLWYRAPELLLGNKAYDNKIDVWSAGCLLAELILRKPLF
jgi:serine/threonine protein kinase